VAAATPREPTGAATPTAESAALAAASKRARSRWRSASARHGHTTERGTGGSPGVGKRKPRTARAPTARTPDDSESSLEAQ